MTDQIQEPKEEKELNHNFVKAFFMILCFLGISAIVYDAFRDNRQCDLAAMKNTVVLEPESQDPQ